MKEPVTARSNANAEIVNMAHALADPTRLRLFLALRQAERCVRDLVSSEAISQSLVSHHLGVLTRAGLVQMRKADGFRLYAVSPDGMTAALGVLSNALDPTSVSPLARPGGNESCCRSG